MTPIFYILVVFVAFGGFLLAFYIRHKKKSNEKLVCPIGSDCNAVIHSEYSRFFGIPVELLGILYYGLTAISYGIFLSAPHLVSPMTLFLVLVSTTTALLFSLYLTFIQAFVLRQWCTWCLTSAGLCAIIFGSAIAGSQFEFLPLLAEYGGLIAVLHILGAGVGLGSATISDVLFFKFLRDFKISEWEADILGTLSRVIWVSLAILVISGAGLYLPDSALLNESPKFLAKMIIVAVIIVNGAFLNLWITPRLVKISFGGRHEHEAGELHYARRLAFALGAISVISWYSAFILGSLRESPAGFSLILGGYFLLIAGGVVASQIMERAYAHKGDPV